MNKWSKQQQAQLKRIYEDEMAAGKTKSYIQCSIANKLNITASSAAYRIKLIHTYKSTRWTNEELKILETVRLVDGALTKEAVMELLPNFTGRSYVSVREKISKHLNLKFDLKTRQTKTTTTNTAPQDFANCRIKVIENAKAVLNGRWEIIYGSYHLDGKKISLSEFIKRGKE